MASKILERFKIKINDSTFTKDEYYVDEFLNPAIDRIAALIINDYWVKVSLTGGIGEYNLTDTNIVDISVGAGIAKIIMDNNYNYDYSYPGDFWIKDKTTLVFADLALVNPGSFEFKYSRAFTSIEAENGDVDYSEYVETDAPEALHSYIIQMATALKRLDDIDNFSSTGGGVEEIMEANLKTRFGSPTERRKTFIEKIKEIEMDIRKSQYGRRSHFSIPIK